MRRDTILVVEDEEDIRDLIGMYLETEGFAVEYAEDGKRAVQIGWSGSCDLIILDVNLPGIDGLDVCRRLRKETTVPILFLTCKDDPEDMIDGLSAGGDDYITKPFDPNVLVARVKAHLRRVRLYSDNDTDLPYVVLPESEASTLTKREVAILRLISKGYKNQDISERLGLSMGTVKWYNNQIYGKLGVVNRTQAMLRARQLGMI